MVGRVVLFTAVRRAWGQHRGGMDAFIGTLERVVFSPGSIDPRITDIFRQIQLASRYM